MNGNNECWIAENVPAYLVEPWLDQPWRDEDLALSAPVLLGMFDSEHGAVGALIEECDRWAATSVTEGAYQAAVSMLMAGSTAVKVQGRYLRVRPGGKPSNWRQKIRQEDVKADRDEVLREVMAEIKNPDNRKRVGTRINVPTGNSWRVAHEIVRGMLR